MKAPVRAPTAQASPPAPTATLPVDPRWAALTERTLQGIATCDEVFRPTNFWTPGVQTLLTDMQTMGLAAFKSWPAATFWFYPTYGKVLPPAVIRQMVKLADLGGPPGGERWLKARLRGVQDARRDYDVVRLAWDQARWPMDLAGFGESGVGQPTQTYRFVTGDQEAVLTKPYLNYLLCLAALSQHVTEPPQSFLELGGGYGTLGEIVLARDHLARYVNLDIPPLLTVSSYYLTELFGHDRVLTYDERVADDGPIEPTQSACLPNWRIADLRGSYDVFVNCFSFQEMEPAVVERYVDIVAGIGPTYVVSRNSRAGKALAAEAEIGVVEQVTSAMIISLFEARGYELCDTYNEPLVLGAAELAVLRRR
jgi:putative sugar O-methyltransferase